MANVKADDDDGQSRLYFRSWKEFCAPKKNMPGVYFVAIVFGGIIFSWGLFNFLLLPSADLSDNAYFYHSLSFNLAIVYISAAYFSAMFLDPGRTPHPYAIAGKPVILKNEIPMCDKGCGVLKPVFVHHCRYCDKCCIGYDHHWYAFEQSSC